MIGLLQRVTEASVSIAGREIARIGPGLLVLVGVQPDDDDARVARLAERVAGYRVFPDDAGRMNVGLADTGYGLLLVPQFTLAADTRKGMRASFARAAPPEVGRARFDDLVRACREQIEQVECGEFGADMQVQLINDGPVTFWLQA